MSNVNQDNTGVFLVCTVSGLEILHHAPHQSDAKLRLMSTVCLLAFPVPLAVC